MYRLVNPQIYVERIRSREQARVTLLMKQCQSNLFGKFRHMLGVGVEV